MHVADRIALGSAALIVLYGLGLSRTGRGGLSILMAVLTVLLAAESLRRWRKRPRCARRRELQRVCADAKQALCRLSLCSDAQVVDTIRAVLCAVYVLSDVALRPDGFFCREDGTSVWVQVICRHPEAGNVSAADIALAARRAREEGAEKCAVCALCAAGKGPADGALRAVRVLDAGALAQLWARSGIPVPVLPQERQRGRLRLLLASLVSPARPGQRARCAGYCALLVGVWALTRSPILLVCAAVQLARAVRGLSAKKKAPVRLCC